MKIEIDEDLFDSLLAERLKDNEESTLKLIGKRIVPMTNVQFHDLYDYFEQLAMLRKALEYYAGRWAHPHTSPNPTEFQTEITNAVKSAVESHNQFFITGGDEPTAYACMPEDKPEFKVSPFPRKGSKTKKKKAAKKAKK